MRRAGSSPPEYWEPDPEYWLYLPTATPPADVVPLGPSLNPGGRTRDLRWWFYEPPIGGPIYGFDSFPPSMTPRSSIRALLIDDSNTYPRPRPQNPTPHTPPTYQGVRYNQALESRLNQDEQNQAAVSKLRKQLYIPHLSSIIKRLGTKPTGGGATKDDEDIKRCAVCLEDFETKQFVTMTPCNHMFHEECIVPWVKSQGKCPVCRFVIAEQNIPPRYSNTAATIPAAAATAAASTRGRALVPPPSSRGSAWDFSFQRL